MVGFVCMKTSNKTLEDQLYLYGLIALVFIVIVSVILFFVQKYDINLPPCTFNMITGLYCPGCGGTRAIKALLHGQIIKSALYHPFVLYGVVIYLWFMISHTIRKFINHNVKGMQYRNIYIYIWLVILVLNFIIRNILLVKFNITLD